MAAYEVEKLLSEAAHKEEKPRAKIEFHEGEKVRVKEGPLKIMMGPSRKCYLRVAV